MQHQGRYSHSFNTLNSDKRIHYENGSEDIAKLVKENMDTCIDEVVKNEYVPFSQLSAINVYIFNDYQRYARFSNTKGGRASSSENDIYISPKIKNSVDALPSIIAHELSHIHLRQYVGSWKSVYGIPAWFKEGLAVTTSNGACAEGVSRNEAIVFILQGASPCPVRSSQQPVSSIAPMAEQKFVLKVKYRDTQLI
jgi:uncharacterized protein YjaZ